MSSLSDQMHVIYKIIHNNRFFSKPPKSTKDYTLKKQQYVNEVLLAEFVTITIPPHTIVLPCTIMLMTMIFGGTPKTLVTLQTLPGIGGKKNYLLFDIKNSSM